MSAPALAGTSINLRRDDDATGAPAYRQLSPLELAAIFAPPGTVPAVIVRPDGQVILHHCPADVAENLPREGSA